MSRRQAQAALHRLGYDPGRVDGVFGPHTRAAIRRFQQAIGATPTGSLTAEEVNRLVTTATHYSTQPVTLREVGLVDG